MEHKAFHTVLNKSVRGKEVLYLFLNAARGLILPATMLLIQRMIDGIAVSSGLAARSVLLLGLTLLADLLLFYGANYLELVIKNRLEYDGGALILARCGSIAYPYYENGAVYQTIQELMNRYPQIFWERIRSLGFALQLAGSLAGIVYYLLQAGPWILCLLSAAIALPLLLSIYATKREFGSWEELLPFYLKSRYLTELLTKRRHIREARIFQYRCYVEQAWEEALMKFHQGQLKSNLKPRYLSGICVFFQYFVTIAVLFLLFPRIQEQTLTVGVFAAAAQAMWSFAGEFQYGVIQMIKGLQNGRLFDRKLNEFLELALASEDEKEWESDASCVQAPQSEQLAPKPQLESLVLKDLWYRYGAQSAYVLKGVCLTIRKGEKTALVGSNGCGKTTLIKILLGLLVPERGEIWLNGILITDRNRSLLRAATSAVFQDYIQYSLPLWESLNLGRESAASKKQISAVLDQLQPKGTFLAAMRDGLDTFLGKEIENGQELSGGQWQTVALARALLSEKEFLMLDEPTAALDPAAEAAVYDLIYEKKREKAVLLVTHRLGAVVHADRIYVLKDGAIAEAGSHRELMRRNQDYAQLFLTQQHWYQKRPSAKGEWTGGEQEGEAERRESDQEGEAEQREVELLTGGICNG